MKAIIFAMVALFVAEASASAQTAMQPCNYQAPTAGAPMETRPVGTSIQGFNAIGTSGFNSGQGFRVAQLRSWGWTVEWEFVSHAGRVTATGTPDRTDRLFIVAICTGLPVPNQVQVEFCSDRIDNNGDGQIDEGCQPLAAAPCPDSLFTKPLVSFTPSVLDYYNFTAGYVLEIIGPQTLQVDLGRPPIDKPLDISLKDFRVEGCVGSTVAAVGQLPEGDYVGYIRACRQAASGEQPFQPIAPYTVCSDRSAGASFTVGPAPTTLRFKAPTTVMTRSRNSSN